MHEEEAGARWDVATWADAIIRTVGPLGIITSVKQLLRRSGDFPVHLYGATLRTPAAALLDPEKNSLVASGVGLSSQQALLATLGEAMERYALAQENPWFVPETAPANLLTDKLSRLPILFSPIAHSWEALRQELKQTPAWLRAHPWTGFESQKEDSLLIPSSLIFANHATDILPACSNGMAAGPQFPFAALRAVYELIERDALLLSWYWCYAGKRVPLEQILPKSITRWINRLHAWGLGFHLYDISTEFGVFVFLGCIVMCTKGQPRNLAFGAGCSLDPRKAARRAFLEATLCRRGADDLAYTRGLLDKRRLAEYRPETLADHLYLYQHPAMLVAADFLFDCPIAAINYPEDQPKRQAEAELSDVLCRLRAHHYTVYFLDMTPPELRPLHIHVVRAIAPGLIPFFWGKYQPPPLPRWQAPPHLAAQSLNAPIKRAPHPFP